jgi:hypothetical protein
VEGNPINFTDPSGHICLDPWAPSGVHFASNRGCDYPEGSEGILWWRKNPIGTDTPATPTPLPPSTPLAPATATPIPLSTLIPVDGQSAANWAMINLGVAQVPEYLGSDCTNFVSQALHFGGGLPSDDRWKPWWLSPVDCSEFDYNCPWLQTEDLYDYFVNGRNFSVLGPVETLIDFYSDGSADRGQLIEEQNLLSLIRTSRNIIQPGDLVFYLDPGGTRDDWSHVAIVVGWEFDNRTGMEAPKIVEHDGPDVSIPRFIYETPNRNVTKVAIVLIGR